MPEPAVNVVGAKELARDFRKATGSTRDLSRAHREVGRLATDRSKGRAASAAPQQQKAARALLGKGTSSEASVAVRNMGSVPFGIGAFMGAIQYRQFPPWVGNSWDIEAGEGPYVIAEAIASGMPEILETFEAAIGHAITGAGLHMDYSPGAFGLPTS